MGAWLLAEIESERRWSDLFEKPGTVMERMADEALDEHARGLTTPLDPDPLGIRASPGGTNSACTVTPFRCILVL